MKFMHYYMFLVKYIQCLEIMREKIEGDSYKKKYKLLLLLFSNHKNTFLNLNHHPNQVCSCEE